MKRGRRHGRQRKRWEDNIGEWTCLEFAKFQRAMKKREKMEETGCEIMWCPNDPHGQEIDEMMREDLS